MPTGIVLKSITNAQDGQTAIVEIAGTPNGPVSFMAGRTPDISSTANVSSADGADSKHFVLTFSTPVLWWVFAQDCDGVTDPLPVWIGTGDEDNLYACGRKLKDILNDNLKAIDLAVATVIPGESIKSLIFGSAISVRAFPTILVTKPRKEMEWAGMPYSRVDKYSFEVYLMLLHQTNTQYLAPATSIMGRIMEILNQPSYFDFILDSGVRVQMAYARSGEVEDVELEENKFGILASIVWGAESFIMDFKQTP